MRILVTSAAGFIGSHLVEACLEQSHQVLEVDNFNAYYAPEIKRFNTQAITELGCELLELDLASDNLQPYLQGVDVVYHCAAQSGIFSSIDFHTFVRNNLDATHHLLEASTATVSIQRLWNR